jgi:hypothetical protein
VKPELPNKSSSGRGPGGRDGRRREFAALEEWEELYWKNPLGTPFQSWAWLYSW